MTLRVFMSFINRALTIKTGKPQPWTARKIHGQVRGYVEDYPEEITELAGYFDLAPREWKPERYVAYMRSRVRELRHEKAKPLRSASQHDGPQSIGSILHELSSQSGR